MNLWNKKKCTILLTITTLCDINLLVNNRRFIINEYSIGNIDLIEGLFRMIIIDRPNLLFNNGLNILSKSMLTVNM